ncbi:MAG: hypothetical protein DBY32_09075 [Phascolarctobacterium sp.]|nr:MAG: hypothetical protein DBY32_09075 [Phascolarctobacterium sp.]
MKKLQILGAVCLGLMMYFQPPVMAAEKTVIVNSADNLNFGYAVETEKSKYAPQHIFDDGNKTYILLSEKADGKYIRIMGKRIDGNYDLIRPQRADEFLILPGIYESLNMRIDDVLVKVLKN